MEKMRELGFWGSTQPPKLVFLNLIYHLICIYRHLDLMFWVYFWVQFELKMFKNQRKPSKHSAVRDKDHFVNSESFGSASVIFPGLF